MKGIKENGPTGRSHLQSFRNASCLGGCTGSLYLSLVLMPILPGGLRILAFIVTFVAGTFISAPLLFLVSAIVGPFVISRFIRYRKHRTLVFGFSGGMAGVAISTPLLLLYHLLTYSPAVPNWATALAYFLITTAAFCYGGATGAFLSLDLGTTDDALHPSSTKRSE